MGVLLIAAPVVLHLVMRRKPQTLVFPALRFVQRRRQTNQTRLRLRQLLLLALRCLAIALVALALARPVLRGSGIRGGSNGGIAAALVFDTSPQMAYRAENQTRLAASQRMAQWLLEQMPAEAQVAVADRNRGVVGAPADPTATRRRVDRLHTSPAVRGWGATLSDALRAFQQIDPTRRELYVFTDLAEQAWPPAERAAVAAALDADPTARVYLVDVGSENPQNVGLGPLSLAAESIAIGEPASLSAELYRSAARHPGSIVAELWVEEGDQPVKRGEQLVDLKDRSAEVRFTLAGLEPGVHQGSVRIGADDPMPDDDIRYFTLRVAEPRSVLLVAPTPSRAVFLREAIAPSRPAPGVSARFLSSVETYEMLAGVAADASPLDAYAAVCLLDPPPLSDAVWESLRGYVERGGGLGVLLGRRALRDAMNAAAAQALLPAALRWKSLDATYVRPSNYQHPVISSLAPLAEAVPWRMFPVNAYWELEGLDATAVVVAPLANGQPALIDQRLGAGRVLTMTTPVSDSASEEPWNELAIGRDPWPFLALATGMADYLTMSNAYRLNFVAGETPSIAVRPSPDVFPYVLRTPDGAAQRQSLPPDQAEILIPLAEQVGNYRLRAGGESSRLDEGFSVNCPPEVGRLDRLDPQQLLADLGPERTRIVRSRDELAEGIELGRVGRDLFPWCMGLLALVAMVELVASNRFYSDQHDPDRSPKPARS